MTSPEEREEEIFREAMQRAAGAERESYLVQVCAGDAALLARMRELLALEDDATSFLEPEQGPLRILVKASETWEKPGDLIGRYKLIRKIGEGGFGVVYEAEQHEPVTRSVALKIIKPGMDSRQVVARFEAERQALAMMEHSSITKVLDAGTSASGRPYFVMELVHGLRITEFCERERLPLRQRLELMIQVCLAVQHAHQKGVIHRDLKPSNILIAGSDGEVVAKVIDFGIAKAVEGRLSGQSMVTAFHQFIGTPAYMSPEQAENVGGDVDTRTDIYALGVLLYELVTGRTPFEAAFQESGVEALRKAILSREPTKPSSRLAILSPSEVAQAALTRQTDPAALKKAIRGDLDWIIIKCLEKDPDRRYQTASELGSDLRRYLNDQAVLAGPPSELYRLRKLIRRNRLAFGAGAAVAASLVIGLVVSLSLWTREREARVRAVKAEGKAVRASLEAKGNLAWSDFLEANRLLAGGQDADALAYLARSVTINPTNHAATMRLLTLLSHNSWMIPTAVTRHPESITGVAFSPDGKLMATACKDGLVRVCDADTCKQEMEPLRHGSGVLSVKFSADGTLLVTTSWDQTARVWEVSTGKMISRLKHDSAVWMADFDREGERIVSAAADGNARVWRTKTGQPLGDPLRHGASVRVARFSPDGRSICTASEDGTAAVWDAESFKRTTKMSHDGWVLWAEFSPDGGRLATASADHTARVWDARTGQPITQGMRHGSDVLSARFSADGSRVVTASIDGTAQIWDAATGTSLTSLAHRGAVFSAEFNESGTQVVTTSADQTAQLWSASSGERLCQPLKHQGAVKAACFRPNATGVATVSDEPVARVWIPLGPGVLPLRIKEAHLAGSAVFSADEQSILTAASDNTAGINDAWTGESKGRWMVHQGVVSRAVFSPNGELIVTASADHTAQLWNARSCLPVGEPLRHDEGVISAQFSPDGSCILTTSWDKTARLWDTNSHAITPPLRHEGHVISGMFSPDGTRVLTASGDYTARIWDARSGAPVGEPLRHNQQVNSARFSPDGRKIVTASLDSTGRLWDGLTGAPLTNPLRHSEPLVNAEFSRDGARVVTASVDGTARVWDAQTGEALIEPIKIGAPDWVDFSPDGAWIASASSDGMLRLWDSRTGQLVGAPMKQEGQASRLVFSRDGSRIIVTGSGASVWDIPRTPSRSPEWLAQLAEAVSGEALDEQTRLHETTLDRAGIVKELRENLAKQPESDLTRWGKWLLTTGPERTVSPYSDLTVVEWASKRLAAGAVLEAEKCAFAHPEINSRLAEARIAMAHSAATKIPEGSGGDLIYDDQLRNGWEDYSWCEADWKTSQPVHGGAHCITTKAGPWQALFFHHEPFNSARFKKLSLWIHGGDGLKKLSLAATVKGKPRPSVTLSVPGGGWTEVVQSLETLGVAGDSSFDGFWVQDATGTSQGDFYVDDIRLLP